MKTKLPKIGIPARYDYPNASRDPLLGNKTYAGVEQDMLTYLTRAEVMPIMIPPLSSPYLNGLMDELDGILLQGGSDVSPATYRQIPILNGKWPGDLHRDAIEMVVIAAAMERKLPILGICRGFQILNCYFGGTLFQDLHTQRPDSIAHRNVELYDQHFHVVELKEGGVLTDIMEGKSRLTVNSVHHQGIQKLGDSLTVEATCYPDGLIEAFSHADYAAGHILGVQWHPEFCRKGDEMQREADLLLGYWLKGVKEVATKG